jgi:Tfp pilus assembly protein PilF
VTVGVVVLAGALQCTPATTRIDPEASEKRYLLGADYFEKRMFRPALEELLKAIELNPQNQDAHYLLGLLSLEQASESESMIERLSCVSGDEARLERQEIDERFKKAEEEFRKAIAAKPDFSEAWNSLAVVALHFQRWDEAISSTEKALSNALYRQPWAAQGNLAWAYYQKKEYLRAAKELRTALFANPQFCVGRYRLARVYSDQGDLEQAWEHLEKVTSDRACPIQEAYLLAGMVALRRGDRGRAEGIFRRCVELAPKSCLAKQCRIAE